MLNLLALNPLNQTDIIFFIVLAVIIALCVGVYFLIPIINKKQYQELRDNLKNREAAFKSNIQRADGPSSDADEDGSSGGQASPEADLNLSETAPVEPPQNEEE